MPRSPRAIMPRGRPRPAAESRRDGPERADAVEAPATPPDDARAPPPAPPMSTERKKTLGKPREQQKK